MKKNINKNTTKKYQLIRDAKNKIVEYDWLVFEEDIKPLIASCKGKTLKKYVRHVLRCGVFHEGKFQMPTTSSCVATKVKKMPLAFTFDEDFE